MRDVTLETVTEAVIGTFGATTSPRNRAVLSALVRHLHDFARETRLTHDEWRKALSLLRHAGEITDDHRNEFVLFSDVLGLSSMVDMLGSAEGGTPSSVLGPFHILGAPELPVGGDLQGDNPGDTVFVSGHVRGTDGKLLTGADLEIWQTAANGLYSNQDEAQDEYNLRASMRVGEDGRYAFSTVRPAPYTVPDDGPVGEFLRATGRHNWRPSHLHYVVRAPGYRTLVTELFPADDLYLDADAVFGVRDKLVFDYVEHAGSEQAPPGFLRKVRPDERFLVVAFDIALVPA